MAKKNGEQEWRKKKGERFEKSNLQETPSVYFFLLLIDGFLKTSYIYMMRIIF